MSVAPERGHLRTEAGRLRLEDCDVKDLAERFGTPLYVLSDARLRANYRRLRDAFAAAWDGELNVMYAIKANFALAIRRILAQEGAGGDAFGAGELQATLQCGTAPELTSLGGSGKTPELVRQAIAAGVRITLDAPDELSMIADAVAAEHRPATVVIRAKPRLEELNAYRSVPSPYRRGARAPLGDWIWENKWGLTLDEAESVVRAADSLAGVTVAGVHSHVGRHFGYTGQYAAMVPGLVRWIAELRERTGWAPETLDLGGGWAHQADPVLRGAASADDAGGYPELWDDPRAPIEEIAARVCEALRDELDRAGLSVRRLEREPGRYLVSDAVLLLARVISTKPQEGIARYVNVDASVAHFSLPELQDSANTVVVPDRPDAPLEDGTAIVGPSCFEDLLAWDRPLPHVERDDVIAFLDAGACADSYAGNTNVIPRPALVLVRGDRAEVVRRRETIGDIFARDQIPTWLWRPL